jgi:predicted choloylglycine hydrolase
MQLPIETVRGSHYEMGVQHGRAYRHVIIGNVHTYALRHSFQGTDEELDTVLERPRRSHEQFAPWVFEELRGIADGSGIPLPHIIRMHLRVWNAVPRRELQPESSGCTGIGFISDEDGVIVGGTLDDPRQSEVLIRRVPSDGIAHIQVIWAGAGWGHNGVNAAGLFVAQSSTGSTIPVLPNNDSQPRLLGSLAGRILLETCEDVPHALEVLKHLQSSDNFVLGDAKGNLISRQSIGGLGFAVQHPADHENFVFNTNHVHMPELADMVYARGCVPKLTEYSVTRFATLQKARAAMPRTRATMEELLRSHRGYPHSICNDGTVTATYALPQKQPGVIFLADAPPCRNSFYSYAVNDY